MFCVECGKEDKIYKNGVCVNCYVKNNKFTNGPEYIDIYECSSCGLFKYKNLWLDKCLEDVLIRFVKDTFSISSELKKVKIKPDCDKKDKTINCRIYITAYIEDCKIEEEHIVKVRIKKTACENCSKQSGGYYEATLQIRADKRNPSKQELIEIQNFVETLVKNYQIKGNRNLFITDIADEKGGMDFYLSDKGLAYTIAKKILERYGGELKQSSKNVGMKDSKQIYRMTYSVRLPSYRKNDFIFYKDEIYYVISTSTNKVHCMNVSNWNEIIFDSRDIQKATVIGGQELVKNMIVVSQSKNEIQVMDSKSYKTFDLKKPKKVFFDKEKADVLKYEEGLFLLPEKNKIDK